MAAKGTQAKGFRTVFRCGECGSSTPKWSGQCGVCRAWNTIAEEIDSPVAPMSALLAPSSPAVPIDQIAENAASAIPTGIPELDRVLGGGLVEGSVTLVGGEPGIGKSTLLLQLVGEAAASGRRALLISGEESQAQVHLRASRLGVLNPNVWLASETALGEICAQINSLKPDVVVIDSIQTLHDPQMASAPGSVGQVRECTNALVRMAKQTGVTILLVGHVTKEGALAGPRVLEHVVDTVLSFEGDRHHAMRMLRAVKHRFGPTGELGLFEMAESGLIGVSDPSGLFLGDRHHGASGSIVTCAMEGARPLLVETQALVTDSSLSFPRRSTTGLDVNRMSLLVAVLEQRAMMKALMGCDIYGAAVGGVKLVEPAVDLAICLALASAYSEMPLADDVIAVGEVGLAGEVRSVAHLARRLSEAARLGFRAAIVPASSPDVKGIELIRVSTVYHALKSQGVLIKSSKGNRKSDRSNSSGAGEGSPGEGGRGESGGRGGRTSEKPTRPRLTAVRSQREEREERVFDGDLLDDY